MESTLTESDVGRLQSIGEARFSKYLLPLSLSQRSPLMHNFNSSRLKANLNSSLGNVWSQLKAPMIFFQAFPLPRLQLLQTENLVWIRSFSRSRLYTSLWGREGQILGRKKVVCWFDLEWFWWRRERRIMYSDNQQNFSLSFQMFFWKILRTWQCTLTESGPYWALT